MIERKPIVPNELEDALVAYVRSSSGMLIGIFWGDRHDICQAIDEVTDPNGCEFHPCVPGGVQLGCFFDGEEVSVQSYGSEYLNAMRSEEEECELPMVHFEGFSEDCLEILQDDDPWRPLVPTGYSYTAGFGLRKIESDWN